MYFYTFILFATLSQKIESIKVQFLNILSINATFHLLFYPSKDFLHPTMCTIDFENYGIETSV